MLIFSSPAYLHEIHSWPAALGPQPPHHPTPLQAAWDCVFLRPAPSWILRCWVWPRWIKIVRDGTRTLMWFDNDINVTTVFIRFPLWVHLPQRFPVDIDLCVMIFKLAKRGECLLQQVWSFGSWNTQNWCLKSIPANPPTQRIAFLKTDWLYKESLMSFRFV